MIILIYDILVINIQFLKNVIQMDTLEKREREHKKKMTKTPKQEGKK